MKLPNFTQKLAMLGLTLLAFFLRAYRLDFQSYWIDEAWTVFFANLSLAELWHLLQVTEIMPPLYHPSTIYWIKLVGDSEYAMRFYSLVFGVMAVPFTYRLGKALGDDRLGLIAALLVTVAPYQIWHSQEARMYSILTAASVMSMWGFVNMWQRGGWRWWLVYVVGTEWAIAVHYHGAVLIGIQGLFLLLTWQRHWRGYLRWGATLLFLFLLYVPWLIFGSNLLQSYINWIPQPTLWESYLRSAIAYSLNKLVPHAQATPLMLTFITTYGLGLFYATCRRWGKWRGPETLALLLAYTIAPNMAAWIYGELKTSVYLERYMIVVQIGYLLTIAIGILAVVDGLPQFISRAKHRQVKIPPPSSPLLRRFSTYLAALLLFALVSINGWVLYNHYFNPAYAKADWRATAKTIEHFSQPGDAILLTGDGGENAFKFYYQGDLPIYTSFNLLPPTHPDYKKGRPGVDNLDQIMTAISANHHHIWYTPYGVDIDSALEQWLANNTYPAWQRWIGRKQLALYNTQMPTSRQETLNAHFAASSSGQGLTLTQAILPDEPIPAGDTLPLNLTWQASTPLSDNYQVSLRLINNREDTFTQSDWPPLAAQGHTSTWPVNQAINDRRSLWIPPDTPPSAYLLQLVVYNPSSGQASGQPVVINNIVVDAAKNVVPLQTLSIPNPIQKPLHNLTLVGYALPSEVQPGQEMWLWLYLKSDIKVSTLTVDPSPTIRLSISSGNETIATNYPLVDSVGPLDLWQPGQVRRAIYHIPTSPRLIGEKAEIKVSLILNQQVKAETTVAQVNLSTRPHQFKAPSMTHPLEITFGDTTLLKLIGYDLPTSNPISGEMLPVTLYWQAKAEITTNYTVFVQLLNSRGQVIAQVDSQPQGGSAPTTTWLPDEILTDRYQLSLPTDLPSGEYHLITGLYNPATGERLPITPNGNFVKLGDITVQ